MNPNLKKKRAKVKNWTWLPDLGPFLFRVKVRWVDPNKFGSMSVFPKDLNFHATFIYLSIWASSVVLVPLHFFVTPASRAGVRWPTQVGRGSPYKWEEKPQSVNRVAYLGIKSWN